ncbi:DUF1295 domain-containing protein [Pararhodobacter oceanensis]|uniref:DUF1295 domain-containing protein n=1 Tax=Pararhodobacter oceanensis TaxID=2172121 RepID=UPI003A8C8CF9
MTYALIIWLVFIACWRLAMPKEARGRNWNYSHMAMPGVAMAIYAFAPAGLAGPMEFWLWGLITMVVLGTIGWIIGQALRNHSIMDVVYPCISFGIALSVALMAAPEMTLRIYIALGLMAFWMLRMVRHAFGTNYEVEQQPYAAHRKRFGKRWPVWSFFAVYMLQGTLVWVWCLPWAFIALSPEVTMQLTDWIGVAVWTVGILFLIVADAQMNAFKANPANKGGIMDKGLWARSRHPNYFGECLTWFGYFMFALSHPWGWISIIAPIYTTWFMGWGSAAPGNEGHMRKTRGALWDDYVARVPLFFPRLFLKRSGGNS